MKQQEMEIPFFKSLHGKIILYMLVVSLLPIIVFGAWSTVSDFSTTSNVGDGVDDSREQAQENLNYARVLIEAGIEEGSRTVEHEVIGNTMTKTLELMLGQMSMYITERAEGMVNWAADVRIIDAVKNGESSESTAFLKQNVNRVVTIANASVSDLQGNTVLQTSSLTPSVQPDSEWRQAALRGEFYVGDAVQFQTLDIFTMQTATPINDPQTGIVIGVFEATLIMSPSQTSMAWDGIIPEGIIVFVDRSYNLVSDSSLTKRHLDDDPNWTLTEKLALAEMQETTEKSGYVVGDDEVIAFTRWTHDEKMTEYYNIPGEVNLGWSLMVKQPISVAFKVLGGIDTETIAENLNPDEILEPMDSLEDDLKDGNMDRIMHTLYAVIILAFLVVIVAFVIGRSISNPVVELHRGAEEVIKGNWNHKVGREGVDEIALLSRVFDDMVATVKDSQDELEKYSANLEEMVEDRTSELRKTEEEVRATAEKLGAMFETITDGIVITDMNGKIADLNDAVCNMFGYASKKEIIGLSAIQFASAKDLERISKDMADLMSTGIAVENTEYEFSKNDGTIFNGELSAAIMKDVKGDSIGFVAVARDITERKEMQKREREQASMLIQSEKMSTVGTMVAGVAHELNNPLTGIINYGQYCLKHTEESDKKYGVIDDIIKEARRCTEIVRNMLTFSRKEAEGEEGYQKASVVALTDRVLELLTYRIRAEHASVTQHFPDGMPEVLIKENSIQQVLLNLIGNAMDAMKDADAKEIRVEGYVGDGFVDVKVKDNGQGIPSEALEKIFEPFFTTKPVGKGTGLGLAISQSICRQHGGDLICESEVGAGTTFTIRIPLEAADHI